MADVAIDFQQKMATVTYDPSKTTVEKLIASLTGGKKKKYGATLDHVETRYDVGIGTWILSTEGATYSPEGKGKLLLTFEPMGGSISEVKVDWKLDAGATVTPVDSEAKEEITTSHTFSSEFEVAGDVKKNELVVHVLVSYTGKDDKKKGGPAKVDLPGVIVIQK